MPRLRTYEIKDAKLGSTQLGAVYKGSTQVYRRPSPEPMSWLPINMELRKAADIWVSPNQSEGEVCCWVVADSMRPYYMDDTVEMAYGGVPGIYPGGRPISEGPEMVVGGVAYKPITFYINVLSPDPNSLATNFNIRQKKYDNTWADWGAGHQNPLQPNPAQPFFKTDKLPSPVHYKP